MWRKLEHEERLMRCWDCSIQFCESGVLIYERDKWKGGFTYPKRDNYKEFADEVFKRIEKQILDITFQQGQYETRT